MNNEVEMGYEYNKNQLNSEGKNMLISFFLDF